MEKSVFSRDYKTFLRLLKDARIGAGKTQAQVASRIGQTQSFVSKCERGERRLDVVEVRAFCKAFGLSFVDFIRTFDRSLKKK